MLQSLKKEFASSFFFFFLVILCPVYAAGEKVNKKYNQKSFANLISKYSKVQVISVDNEIELKKYLNNNLFNDEIVIGMGAGSISSWMRGL